MVDSSDRERIEESKTAFGKIRLNRKLSKTIKFLHQNLRLTSTPVDFTYTSHVCDQVLGGGGKVTLQRRIYLILPQV